MLNSKRYLHFGFLAHIAAEKYIKAYYCFKINNDPPMSHNLLKLSEKSLLNQEILPIFKNLMYKLMPLNIEARYPSYKSEIYKQLEKEYCYKLLSETKDFGIWIKKLIRS